MRTARLSPALALAIAAGAAGAQQVTEIERWLLHWKPDR